MAERVGQILGNYQLLRLLGRGAFAEVYLAEHRYLEVPAAIKLLHVRMEPDTHEQFRREARTIAHLQHPHIIRVLDFGFQEQTPFLVLEYIPNGTLRTRHPKGTRLSLEQIVPYVKQIAPALDYAHQQRVIHRDVKPENMLLTATDEVVLSDFGIAVLQHSLDSVSTHNPSGTPRYMAPEQIRGKSTAASDQYALGVLVYEWLCGEPPFRGSLFEVLSQHLHEPPPSLCARIPSLPPGVEDVVFGALAKEPHARFASVQEFAEVLEAVCEATQTLSVHGSSERLSREQSSPPEALAASVPVPSSQVQQRSSSSMSQPHIVVRQHTADTEELVAVQVRPSSSQTHASSGREGVSVSQTNRKRLLRKVRAYWIAGVFEHSLHGAALLALGLQEQPGAVANPWQLVLQHPAGAPRPLPAGMHITEVYDAAEGELLILGAPGSGKTTLLLELARELLSRAEHDEQHPLPVVFNLSSWAIKQQPLADWLVEELTSTYQVPHKLGQALVDDDQILPLLDGLDEVAPRDRTACIETINTYRQEHGLLPLVVCSRSADYLAQTARIQLGSAVAVQPLTQQQVDDYLARGGEPLWALRVAQQLKQQDQTVFYVEHLQPEWLAGVRMRQAYDRWAVRFPAILMGIFVSLIINSALLPVHNILDPYLALSLVLGGFIGWLLGAESTIQQPHENDRKARRGSWSRLVARLRIGVFVGLSAGLFFGLSYGLGGMLLQAALEKSNRAASSFQAPQRSRKPKWQHPLKSASIRNGILIGLIVGLSFGLSYALSRGLSYRLGYGLSVGLAYGGSYALIGGFLSVLLIGKPAGITLTDELVWSWRSLRRSLLAKQHRNTTLRLMALIGLITVLNYALSDGLSYALHYGLSVGLSLGLVGGLSVWLLLGLFQGVSSETIGDQHRVVPNQGIRRSARNSLVLGLISTAIVWLIATLFFGLDYGLFVGLSFGLSFGLITVLSRGLITVLIIGLCAGLLAGLLNGGLACLRHSVIRLLLWRSRAIPWNYPRFLDDAAERILLRKVGGGYIFVHRLLLDYFASLESTPPLAEARAQRQQAQPVP